MKCKEGDPGRGSKVTASEPSSFSARRWTDVDGRDEVVLRAGKSPAILLHADSVCDRSRKERAPHTSSSHQSTTPHVQTPLNTLARTLSYTTRNPSRPKGRRKYPCIRAAEAMGWGTSADPPRSDGLVVEGDIDTRRGYRTLRRSTLSQRRVTLPLGCLFPLSFPPCPRLTPRLPPPRKRR